MTFHLSTDCGSSADLRSVRSRTGSWLCRCTKPVRPRKQVAGRVIAVEADSIRRFRREWRGGCSRARINNLSQVAYRVVEVGRRVAPAVSEHPHPVESGVNVRTGSVPPEPPEFPSNRLFHLLQKIAAMILSKGSCPPYNCLVCHRFKDSATNPRSDALSKNNHQCRHKHLLSLLASVLILL